MAATDLSFPVRSRPRPRSRPDRAGGARGLPPGPRIPVLLQTLQYLREPFRFFDRYGQRYGDCFTVRLLAQPPTVVFSDPADVREIFAGEGDALTYGEAVAEFLGPILGANSILVM